VVDRAIPSACEALAPATVDEAAFSSLLSEFAWRMATDFPIQSILDHLVERIVDLLPIDGAGVTLISPDLAPRFVASSDPRALLFERLQSELRQGPCVTTYLTGEPVVAADLADEGRFPEFASAAHAAGISAVLTFPLRQPGGRIGALDLYRMSPGLLSTRAMEVAQTLADVTSAYLLNAQTREETLAMAERHRLLSLHDPLTGLPNRLLLQDRFGHATLRARRSGAGAAVLFVDIDAFKAVNDEHGHRTGDQVLIAVGRRLSALARAEDSLARIAGDEFVLLCEDVHHRADAELICQRVRNSFDQPFRVEAGELTISASVGLAYVGPGEPISEGLIDEADRAMYRAKRWPTRAGRA
jgi:diguanylate cyclase (GGDEF)-like protein